MNRPGKPDSWRMMIPCPYAKPSPKVSICISSDNDMCNTSKRDAGKVLATPAMDELKRRLGVAPTPRMLTLSEIALLRQSKKEVLQVVSEVLAGKRNTRER